MDINEKSSSEQPPAAHDPYANSPNRERTLDNVLLGCEPLIVGPVRLQHKDDFDMTWHYMPQVCS